MVEKIMGVYQIFCTVNHKMYIGSSNNVSKRWGYHMQDLNSNRHRNTHLQHAWNKYGEDAFCFSIVELVDDVNQLVLREQYWLDTLQSYKDTIGFNICPTAESKFGHKWSDEQRARHSKTIKAVCGPSLEKANAKNKAVIESGEFYEVYKDKFKLNKQKVIEIIKMWNNGESSVDIAKKLGLKSPTTVCNIIHRKSWALYTKDVFINVNIKKNKRTGAKISLDCAKQIKKMLNENHTCAFIARNLQVSYATVKNIKHGKTWVDIN